MEKVLTYGREFVEFLVESDRPIDADPTKLKHYFRIINGIGNSVNYFDMWFPHKAHLHLKNLMLFI